MWSDLFKNSGGKNKYGGRPGGNLKNLEKLMVCLCSPKAASCLSVDWL